MEIFGLVVALARVLVDHLPEPDPALHRLRVEHRLAMRALRTSYRLERARRAGPA